MRLMTAQGVPQLDLHNTTCEQGSGLGWQHRHMHHGCSALTLATAGASWYPGDWSVQDLIQARQTAHPGRPQAAAQQLPGPNCLEA